jgi:hypothetical protein
MSESGPGSGASGVPPVNKASFARCVTREKFDSPGQPLRHCSSTLAGRIRATRILPLIRKPRLKAYSNGVAPSASPRLTTGRLTAGEEEGSLIGS